MGRVDCFVSFYETDGDRTLMLSFRMDLPEYILAIGNQITHEEFKLGGKIAELSLYGGGKNGEDTGVYVRGDVIPPAALDALYERFDGDDKISYLELSRGDSVIDYEPTAK